MKNAKIDHRSVPGEAADAEIITAEIDQFIKSAAERTPERDHFIKEFGGASELSDVTKWSANFNQRLRDFPRFKAALKKLQDEGVEPTWLTFLLYLYAASCRGLERKQKNAKEAVRRVDQSLRSLNSLKNDLNALESLGDPVTPSIFAKNIFEGASKFLDQLADQLSQHRKQMLPLTSKSKGRFEPALVNICEGVSKYTGKPHQREIVTLLEAALVAVGLPDDAQDVTDGMLAKTLARFKQHSPERFAAIRQKIIESATPISFVDHEAEPTTVEDIS